MTTDKVRGWADLLPEDATAQERAEAAEMSPAIRRALQEADLRAIRLGSGGWKIIRLRRGASKEEQGR